VADARHDGVAVPEEPLERPGLGRRLDNHKWFSHKHFRPRHRRGAGEWPGGYVITFGSSGRTGHPAVGLPGPTVRARRAAPEWPSRGGRSASQGRPILAIVHVKNGQHGGRPACPGAPGSPARCRRRLGDVQERAVASAARMSSADSTSVAPSRSRLWAPRFRPESTGPGTTMTSRPCSSAQPAVISDPLRSPARPRRPRGLHPEMIRFRSGKVMGQRRRAGRELGRYGPAARDRLCEIAVLGRDR
jgi:hypothetical protein